jgi:hypothetical protein
LDSEKHIQALSKKRPRKGRPKLPKGDAKARIVPVRFDRDDLRLVSAAAKANNEGLSEWIRKILRTQAETFMFGSTLHEAMKTVLLQQPDMVASTSTIAAEIARTGLYRRKDGKAPKKNQIGARARKYPRLFAFVAPQTIRLICKPHIPAPREEKR